MVVLHDPENLRANTEMTFQCVRRRRGRPCNMPEADDWWQLFATVHGALATELTILGGVTCFPSRLTWNVFLCMVSMVE